MSSLGATRSKAEGGSKPVEQEILLAAAEEGSNPDSAHIGGDDASLPTRARSNRRRAGTAFIVSFAFVAIAVALWARSSVSGVRSSGSSNDILVLQGEITDGSILSLKRTAAVFESASHWKPIKILNVGSKVVVSGPLVTKGGKDFAPIKATIGAAGTFAEQTGVVQMDDLVKPGDQVPASMPAAAAPPPTELLPQAPMPPVLQAKQTGFDCNAGFINWKFGWSEAKKTYCCTHAGRGCAHTTSPIVYNCNDGEPRTWPGAKQEYCCKIHSKGCDVTTSTSPDPFDCNAGVASFEIGWSEWKKRWCCANTRVGCPDSRRVTGVCHIQSIKFRTLQMHPIVKGDFDDAIRDALTFLARGNSNAAQKVQVQLEDWEGPRGEAVVRFKISPSEQVLMHDVRQRVRADVLAEVLLPELMSVQNLRNIAGPFQVKVDGCYIDEWEQKVCTCENGQAKSGPSCPQSGGNICASCNRGYSLSVSGKCEPNKCSCIKGVAATGAACHTTGKEICGYCIAGYHLNRTTSGNTTCTPNECSCADGFAVTGEACDEHHANICRSCKAGYHVDHVTKQCFPNICTCFNGVNVPDASPLCIEHGSEMCQRCSDFFHVDTASPTSHICKHNKCLCSNGVAAIGAGPPGCYIDGGNICVNCNQGLHLSTDHTCGPKECVCLNGTAAIGDACKMHRGNICSGCHTGFALKEEQCVKDVCHCTNGIPVDGKVCLSDGEEQCADCHDGYHLVADECVANVCTCTNGAQATGATCQKQGREVCAQCDPGFHHKAKTHSDGGLLIECVANLCFCEHGTAATGTSCQHDQDMYCEACNNGYFFDATQHICKPKVCTCEHGEAARLKDCPENGKADCTTCQDGFFLVPGENDPPTKKCVMEAQMTEQPFDCTAGYNRRKTGWSDLKKLWCCDVQQTGCDDNRKLTQKDVCEGKGLSKTQCELVGCCSYDMTALTCIAPDEEAICELNFLIALKASMPADTNWLSFRKLEDTVFGGTGGQTLCLEALDGLSPSGSVGVNPCDSYEPQQHWKYNEGALVNQLGLCAQIRGNVGPSAPLEMVECNANNPQQQWEYVESEQQFKSKASLEYEQYCLAVHTDGVVAGELVTVLSCLQISTHQWILPSDASGTWPSTTPAGATTPTTTPIPLFCPAGTLQIGSINADVNRCGLTDCGTRYDTASIGECRDRCLAHHLCQSFTWAPLQGDKFHMNKTVCSIYQVGEPDQQLGPNQIMCKPQPEPLTCPYRTTQVGGVNADVNRCGLEDCSARHNVPNITACRDRCEKHSYCKSFSWAPIRGDKLHLNKTVCSLYGVDQPDQEWGPNQIMCKPDVKPLVCPSGTRQVGSINADVSSCGLDKCEDRHHVLSIDACRDRCQAHSQCASFTWAPVFGDKHNLNKTVCSIYAVDEPDSELGPHQIMCKPTPVPLTCPFGSEQVGSLNADVSRCGLDDCNVRYDVDSIITCRDRCKSHGYCQSFSWAPLKGDRLHMDKTVCSLYAVDKPDQEWGPNQIMCKPLVTPLVCPNGTSQVGELNADVNHCGLTGCDDRHDVVSIQACRERCQSHSSCQTFTWAPVGGDKLHMHRTVCTLYGEDKPNQKWGPNQIMCKPDIVIVPLACPHGTEQVGSINADVNRCGLEGCEVRYNITTIETCRDKCQAHGFCKSFTWAPIKGDKLHMNQPVCSLYAVDVPDQEWGPNQIMCKPVVTGLACPQGTVQVGNLNADRDECGLTGCRHRYGTRSIEACQLRCAQEPKCKAFTYAPRHGDRLYLNDTVCSLYDVDAPNQQWGPNQIMCRAAVAYSPETLPPSTSLPAQSQSLGSQSVAQARGLLSHNSASAQSPSASEARGLLHHNSTSAQSHSASEARGLLSHNSTSAQSHSASEARGLLDHNSTAAKNHSAAEARGLLSHNSTSAQSHSASKARGLLDHNSTAAKNHSAAEARGLLSHNSTAAQNRSASEARTP